MRPDIFNMEMRFERDSVVDHVVLDTAKRGLPSFDFEAGGVGAAIDNWNSSNESEVLSLGRQSLNLLVIGLREREAEIDVDDELYSLTQFAVSKIPELEEFIGIGTKNKVF